MNYESLLSVNTLALTLCYYCRDTTTLTGFKKSILAESRTRIYYRSTDDIAFVPALPLQTRFFSRIPIATL